MLKFTPKQTILTNFFYKKVWKRMKKIKLHPKIHQNDPTAYNNQNDPKNEILTKHNWKIPKRGKKVKIHKKKLKNTL